MCLFYACCRDEATYDIRFIDFQQAHKIRIYIDVGIYQETLSEQFMYTFRFIMFGFNGTCYIVLDSLTQKKNKKKIKTAGNQESMCFLGIIYSLRLFFSLLKITQKLMIL